jgi:hypothetical protein
MRPIPRKIPPHPIHHNQCCFVFMVHFSVLLLPSRQPRWGSL